MILGPTFTQLPCFKIESAAVGAFRSGLNSLLEARTEYRHAASSFHNAKPLKFMIGAIRYDHFLLIRDLCLAEGCISAFFFVIPILR